MKKKRFMGLLALASCVTLLTGCESDALFGLGGMFNNALDGAKNLIGIKEEEKPEEQKPQDTEPEVKPEEKQEEEEEQKPVDHSKLIVGELPTELQVGDTLNLDDYVTLFLISSYSVELSEASQSCATLDGHTITIIGEGQVDFVIKAGNHSHAHSISVIDYQRQALINFFEGVGKNYAIYEYDVDSQTSKLYLGDILVHNDNYVLTHSSWDEDEAGNSIPGGFLRFGPEDEDAYFFSLHENEEEQYEIELQGTTSLTLFNHYNGEIEFDFASTPKEESVAFGGDCFVISGDAAKSFAISSMFMPGGTLSDGVNEYPIDRLEFMVEMGEEQGEPYVSVAVAQYITYKGKAEFWNLGEFAVGANYYSIEKLDEYCVIDNKPPYFDFFNEYFEDGSKIGDYILGPGSLVGTEGRISASYGWVDGDGNAIEQPAAATNFFDGQLPVGSSEWLMSESSVWDVDAQGSPISGKMEVLSGEDTLVFNLFKTDEGFYSEFDSSCSSVWDDKQFTFGGLRDEASYAGGLITEAESEEEEGVVSHTFSFNSSKQASFLSIFFSGIDGMSILQDTCDQYFASWNEHLEEFFTLTLTIIPSQDKAIFDISFEWDDNEIYAIQVISEKDSSVTEKTAQFEQELIEFIA